ncbi:lipoate--protein ligase family protein [Thermogutta sp.]|jgi:lipoate-protein ligase A|uniref:lipoate--protein ligase family protein n=1 Tax=Thermogutta sp. TaxID=1962930 RepID=UPI0032203C5B
MQYLELTLPTPEENLALDEALLRAADADRLDDVLRVWESSRLAVVVGRASRLEEEVDVAQCQSLGVPILRRCSGGCAVVIGRGCLLYSLVLHLEDRPGWRRVDVLHAQVLTKLGEALSINGLSIVRAGISDLAIVHDVTQGPENDAARWRKVSGNSVRYGRWCVLYHGTILYQFDLTWIGRLLRQPPREPDYRAGRPHEMFVANLPLEREEMIMRIRQAWSADSILHSWPHAQMRELLASRYSQTAWHWER